MTGTVSDWFAFNVAGKGGVLVPNVKTPFDVPRPVMVTVWVAVMVAVSVFVWPTATLPNAIGAPVTGAGPAP